MVDLVKIRKKAKERKDAAGASEEGVAGPTPQSPTPDPEPDGSSPAKEISPSPEKSPARKRKRSKPERAETTAEPVSSGGSEIADSQEPRSESSSATVGTAESKLEQFRQSAGKRREAIARQLEVEGGAEDEERRSDEMELLTFTVAGEEYAIDIAKIVEIIPPRPATRVPNAPPELLGVISLRGTIVTIYEIRRALGHGESSGLGAEARIVVAQQGNELLGFVVDRVSRKITVDRETVESHPVVSSAEQAEHIAGVFQQKGTLTILLDLEKLFGQ